MEHRQHCVDDAALAALDRGHPCACLSGIGRQVEVREGRPLGTARRAARVLDEGDVGGIRSEDALVDRRGIQQLLPLDGATHLRRESRARLARLGDRQAQQSPSGEGHRTGEVDGDDRLDSDILGEVLDGCDRLVPGDDDPGTVVLELVSQLSRGVQRIVLDHDGAEAQHRVEGDDVLRAVRQHEGHRVTLLHPQEPQPLRGPVDLLAHLGIRRCRTEELQSDGAAELRDGCRDQVVERPAGQLDLLRHVVGVRLQPGTRGTDAHGTTLRMRWTIVSPCACSRSGDTR